jgi:hypothetical protein
VVVHGGVVDAGDRAGWQCSSFIYAQCICTCHEGRMGVPAPATDGWMDG